MKDSSDVTPIEERHGKLELALIREFLEAHGHDIVALQARTDPAARQLLTEASTYAATRLTEVEARAHYVHDIHSTE